MKRLTVLIPCKNERRNIRACIESVRKVADEIVVADSGSTDDTLAIVREVGGCRIIEREYISAGDFKNWAIPQATGDWILVIDADERISPDLQAEIAQLRRSGPQQDGYWLPRANYFMGHRVRFGPWGTDRLLRLFRKENSRYVGENDHADVEVSSGKVGRLQTRLDHFTCWSYDEFLKKQERYSSYQAEIWLRSGKRVSYPRLYLNAALRFVHIFVLRGGFLDGAVGFQVATLISYYSFQKQARLWQLNHGRKPQDHEPNASRQVAA